jgi:hypothetical protein
VLIDWIAPEDNGSPILSYKIYIQTLDPAVYAIDLENCDGSVASVINALQCTVPVTTLMTAPYNFDWGASIYAKIVATNEYGDSQESVAGNGAIIMTKPDPPISLQEDVTQRHPTAITFSWVDGASNGGDTIIDYRISYAQETSVYTVLAVGITDKFFTAVGLQTGLVYKFKVEARNYVFYSQASALVSILCATIPDVPAKTSTANDGDYITVYWAEPANNGLEITGYEIMFQQ